VSEVVRLQELLAQKEAQIQNLQADNQRQAQEIKLLKERVDLLIRRIFGTKSEKLDVAQLELLLKEAESGKADASTEKVEATPIVENLKPAAKRAGNNQRRERWPEEIKENPEAFRCIGEEVTETLDYRPAKFFRHQIIRREFVRRQEPELTR
jgi:transposase